MNLLDGERELERERERNRERQRERDRERQRERQRHICVITAGYEELFYLFFFYI